MLPIKGTMLYSPSVDKEKALVDLAPHTRHKSLSTLHGLRAESG
jgi:hypothetical protein